MSSGSPFGEKLSLGDPARPAAPASGAPAAFALNPPAILKAAPPTQRYGGWKLQLGDNDIDRVWEGKKRDKAIVCAAQVQLGTCATLGYEDYVFKLKQDLDTLGFGYFDLVDGVFDVFTECALREFQAYAGSRTIAKEEGTAAHYCQRLVPTDNWNAYYGPISGVLNEKTAALIAHWLENGWRCPVVVVAIAEVSTTRVVVGAKGRRKNVVTRRRQIVREKLWRYDQYTGPGNTSMMSVTFAARDVSGHYPVPEPRATAERDWKTLDDGFRAIGAYYRKEFDDVNGKKVPSIHRFFGGIETRMGRHTWNDTSVSPELCFDKPWNDPLLTKDEQQSFLLIRAVAEQECGGFLDRINTWDRCVMSFGLCHFIMFALAKETDAHGAALFTQFDGGTARKLLSALDQQEYEHFFGRFGMRIEKLGGAFQVALDNEEGGRLSLDPNPTIKSKIDKTSGLLKLRTALQEKQDLVVKLTRAGKTADAAKAQAASTALAGKVKAAESVALMTPDEEAELKLLEHRVNFIKSWHWSYRFQMANRCSQTIRRASVVGFVKQYLLPLLRTPCFGVAGIGPSKAQAAISDVFKSPYLLTFLAMRYVNRPKDFAADKLGPIPKLIIDEAKKAHPDPRWNGDPSLWPLGFQAHLANAIESGIAAYPGAKTQSRWKKSYLDRYKKFKYGPAGKNHPLDWAAHLNLVMPLS